MENNNIGTSYARGTRGKLPHKKKNKEKKITLLEEKQGSRS
jgi:hypothetical protein